MLCFANVIVFIYFLWSPYAPAMVNGGSRNFYTWWWTLSVNREVTTWIFSWSSLNYRDGPKSDEIWHIFRPRPQTFCSHTRTSQNFGPRAGALAGFGSRQPGKVAAARLIGLGDRQSGSRFAGIRSAISSNDINS